MESGLRSTEAADCWPWCTEYSTIK